MTLLRHRRVNDRRKSLSHGLHRYFIDLFVNLVWQNNLRDGPCSLALPKFVLYRAAWNPQARSSDENSVCLSVVCQTRELWQNGRKISTDFYTIGWYERSFNLVFWEKEWLVGAWGRPLLPEILGQPAPVGAKSPILNRYWLVAPQPQHLAKKFN